MANRWKGSKVTMRVNQWCILVLLCACSSEIAPEPGTERGPCYGNGTCNSGLVCASDICVFLGDAGPITEDASISAFERAVEACVTINLVVWCNQIPNSDSSSLEELREKCEMSVLTEAGQICLDQYISLYECGIDLFRQQPECFPGEPRDYPWVSPCGGAALHQCQENF